MRIAVLERKKCKPELCNYKCIRVCPGVRLGEKTIVKEGKFPKISETLCTGCGICVHQCPFGAIHIINLKEEKGKLIHRYGENAYRLYGLPSLKEGRIVGILGVNGIGKTTVCNVLSGLTIPNFGDFEEKDQGKL